MTKESLRIVFMGTPTFATTILKKLVDEKFNVVGCVTVADKPAGRGQKLTESDVKSYAKSQNLPVLQPLKLKDPDFIQALSNFNADLFIVVAFRMLPQIVWQMPQLGTINLHGSLLPNYRGAAPINWAIINGETTTGVTSFFINDKIDTGDILLQAKMNIGENETAGELHDRMMHLGAEVVQQTILNIIEDNLKATPQNELLNSQNNGAIKEAPKLFKEDGKLNLNNSIAEIHNRIRGLSPFPCAWISLEHVAKNEQKTFKIFRSRVKDLKPQVATKLAVENKELLLKTSKGVLLLDEIQLEGKKRMNSKDFITGFRPEEWKIID